MGFGYVPNVFQNRTGYLPLRELDADLAYVSGKVISVKDFGAVGDGVTDDFTAIRDSLNYGATAGTSATVVFPPSIAGYRSSTAIAIANANGLILQGGSGGTAIVFDAGVDGLSLTYNNQFFAPRLRDLQILTRQPGPVVSGTGLTITGPVLTTAYSLGPVLERVLISGYTTTSMGWSKQIKFSNVWYAVGRDCTLKGYSAIGAGLNSYESLFGVHFENVMVPMFTNLIAQHINTPVFQDGSSLGCEGYVFNNCQFVGCRVGFNIGNGVTTPIPGGQIVNCHIDCSLTGIIIANRVQSDIMNVSLYRTNGSSEALWTGIQLAATLSGGFSTARNNFINNIYFGNTSAVLTAGVGVDLTGPSSDNLIANLTGDAWNSAGTFVQTADTASNNTIDATTIHPGPSGTLWAKVTPKAGFTGVGNRISDIYRAPRTITAATDTLAETDLDQTLICNRAGTVTLTLPAAASYTGATIVVKTIQAQTVVSASANVVPRAGGAAGTAMLAATAGNWCKVKSDGTNWIQMEGTA